VFTASFDRPNIPLLGLRKQERTPKPKALAFSAGLRGEAGIVLRARSRSGVGIGFAQPSCGAGRPRDGCGLFHAGLEAGATRRRRSIAFSGVLRGRGGGGATIRLCMGHRTNPMWLSSPHVD